LVTGSYAKFKKTDNFVEAIVFMVAKGSQDIIQQARLANGAQQVGDTGNITQVPLAQQVGLKTPRAKGKHFVI